MCRIEIAVFVGRAFWIQKNLETSKVVAVAADWTAPEAALPE